MLAVLAYQRQQKVSKGGDHSISTAILTPLTHLATIIPDG
jgi:hypothetical protein